MPRIPRYNLEIYGIRLHCKGRFSMALLPKMLPKHLDSSLCSGYTMVKQRCGLKSLPLGRAQAKPSALPHLGRQARSEVRVRGVVQRLVRCLPLLLLSCTSPEKDEIKKASFVLKEACKDGQWAWKPEPPPEQWEAYMVSG